MSERVAVEPSEMALPDPAIPRPGDRVSLYEHQRRLTGVLLGHGPTGRPIVQSSFGTPFVATSFDSMRIVDLGSRLPPNWHRVPSIGACVRPTPNEHGAFQDLLAGRTAPGPRYIDLIEEIHNRGYETFVVGGTVRDVLRQAPGKDVDLVTTMPLLRAQDVLRQMYGTAAVPRPLPLAALRNGHLKLGGSRVAEDAFIDFCVFKHSSIGTRNAIFSDDFEFDTANRDFACNSVYYDPINDVLIDPSGYGIDDAEEQVLRLVASTELRSPYQLGQVVVRLFKFVSRGMALHESLSTSLDGLLPHLASMDSIRRASYVRTQILSKTSSDKHEAAYAIFAESWSTLGLKDTFDEYIDCNRDMIMAIA